MFKCDTKRDSEFSLRLYRIRTNRCSKFNASNVIRYSFEILVLRRSYNNQYSQIEITCFISRVLSRFTVETLGHSFIQEISLNPSSVRSVPAAANEPLSRECLDDGSMPGSHCAVKWATRFIRKRAVVFCLRECGIASGDQDTRFSELSRYTRSCRLNRLAWERSAGKDNNSPRPARYRRELYVRRSSSTKFPEVVKEPTDPPCEIPRYGVAVDSALRGGKQAVTLLVDDTADTGACPFFSPATSDRGFYSSPPR